MHSPGSRVKSQIQASQAPGWCWPQPVPWDAQVSGPFTAQWGPDHAHISHKQTSGPPPASALPATFQNCCSWRGSPNRLRAPVLPAPGPQALQPSLAHDSLQYKAQGRQGTGRDNRPPSVPDFSAGRSVRTQDGKQNKPNVLGVGTGRRPHRTTQQPDRIPSFNPKGGSLRQAG